MTKSVSGGYEAHIALSTIKIAHCIKCTRLDGDVFGFTSHDRRLVVDGTTYVPGFRPFAVKSSADMAVMNTDIEAGFGSDRVTTADIAAGLWDYCLVEHFRVNWSDLTQGIEKVSKGRLGQISRGRTGFTAELLGQMAHLNQTIGRTIEPACDAELGDARCKVQLDPSVWTALTAYTPIRPTADAGLGIVVKPPVYNNRHFELSTAGTSGAAAPSWNLTIGGTTNDGSAVWTTRQALTVISTVTSVVSRYAFYDGARTEAADFFGGGKVTFTTGLNAGLSVEVKEFPGGSPTGLVVLQLPFPYDIAVGNAYTMTAGCRFRFATDCIAKFRNAYNFRGFPHLPGTDYLQTGKVAA